MNADSELVLGIIQTVGTNSTDIIHCIIDSLKKFRYQSEIIKVSKMILSEFSSEKPVFEKEFDRISFFMNLGNDIRKKTNDGAIVMKGVSAYIYETYRSLYGDAPRKRVAYIIDSIKHPEFLKKNIW